MIDSPADTDIAIIGMAGRFPGALNVEQFWHNIRDGVEAISFFTDDELRAMQVPDELLTDPLYVKAAARLDGADLFDAGFFGYTPREAEIMDPQHRVFLECAWEALENSGYCGDKYKGSIGVFGGATINTYLLLNLLSRSDLVDSLDLTQINIANGGDFLTTRVSYKLNLKGPSHLVQSACSTSLVAVHIACQNLLDEVCDMALAGGVSINFKFSKGYRYLEGGMASPDGHCRTFDAGANGTIFGSGVGIVVLKRLSDALLDRDTIHAVIKGSAINNDGSLKVGYTAPSVEGQAQVISEALANAGVSAGSISYVEAHGTATPLGDPVEIAALTKAFRASTLKTRFCAIGSVKSNIGHLDAAAGVAGLIKTVLALKHKLIPASLHFHSPNPAIDFDNSPFFVNDRLKAWESDAMVRRAGVSSFGVGGTNAHLIVEEWQQEANEAAEKEERWEVVVVSGRSPEALEEATREMGEYLSSDEAAEIGDISYTTREGRKGFERRRAVISRGVEEAAMALGGKDAQKVVSGQKANDNRTLVFMFPGQGAQYINMCAQLYRNEKSFREQVDICSDILRPLIGCYITQILFPASGAEKRAERELDETRITQPALFVIEYSLAKLWGKMGVKPDAMIGHSVGEYVAACLAGVLSLEDSLRLVAARGRLMQSVGCGGMIAVAAGEDEVKEFEREGIWLAAVNGPGQVVLSGRDKVVDEVQAEMRERGIQSKRLKGSYAFHSGMMETIQEEFEGEVAKATLQKPKVKYLSSLTGGWVTAEEVTDVKYWVRQLRQAVRFKEGLRVLSGDGGRIFLEVGPGEVLTKLVKIQCEPGVVAEASIGGAEEKRSEQERMARALARMWVEGVEVDWREYDKLHHRRRVPLPTYPFQRSRFWLDPMPTNSDRPGLASAKINDISRWFYAPSWSRCQPPSPSSPPRARSWLIFDDQLGLGRLLAQRRREEGELAFVVKPGPSFNRLADDEFEIDITSPDDYGRLLDELIAGGAELTDLAHLLGVRPLSGQGQQRVVEAIERCYTSLLLLGQAVSGRGRGEAVRMGVVTSRMQEVESWEESEYEKAVAKGVVKVLGQEVEGLRCQSIDIVIRGEEGESERVVRQIEEEMSSSDVEGEVAYRGRLRWVRRYESVEMNRGEDGLKQGGVYLITGGLGRVGLALAQSAAQDFQARISIVDEIALPPRELWEASLSASDEQDPISQKIRKIISLEEAGADVLAIKADTTDPEQMESAVTRTIEQFGRLDGVIFSADLHAERLFNSIEDIDIAQSKRFFEAQAQSLYSLDRALRDRDMGFCLLMSSLTSILGGPGYAAISAANQLLDSFASSKKNNTKWIGINWDVWRPEGNKAASELAAPALNDYGIGEREAIEVFRLITSSGRSGQIIVSTGDLSQRIQRWISDGGSATVLRSGPVSSSSPFHPRPDLQTPYIAPSNEAEEKIADIWQKVLGIEKVGVDDNFFDLGGDSLIALQVIAELKRAFEFDIPVVSLYERLTTRALAALLSNNSEGAAAADGQGESREERMLRRKQFQQKKRSRAREVNT